MMIDGQSFENFFHDCFVFYQFFRSFEGFERDRNVQFDGLKYLCVHTISHTFTATDEDNSIVGEQMLFKELFVLLDQILHIHFFLSICSAFCNVYFQSPFFLIFFPLLLEEIVILTVLNSEIPALLHIYKNICGLNSAGTCINRCTSERKGAIPDPLAIITIGLSCGT